MCRLSDTKRMEWKIEEPFQKYTILSPWPILKIGIATGLDSPCWTNNFFLIRLKYGLIDLKKF